MKWKMSFLSASESLTFSTPWHVRQEAIDTLQQGKTWYSPNRGFELRQEICKMG